MPTFSRIDRWVCFYKYWRGTPQQRRIQRAREKGWREAAAFLKERNLQMPERAVPEREGK